MNIDIKFKIRDKIRARGAYHQSVNGKQHYTRCPFCGDSRNMSHAHFSIFIDLNNDSPMVFRCLKCGVSGMLTTNILEELDIQVDNTMRQELRMYNRKAMKHANLVNLEVSKYAVPLYNDTSLNNMKLEYLNHRLGTDLDLRQAHDSKVVLNLFDFMSMNDMKKINGLSFPMMKLLNESYIGFLSCNNNCITFRSINPENKYRYFKVILNEKNVNQDTFYALPSKMELMYTKDINIHIAEGIFDILSIKHNLVKDTESNLYYAMCGFGGVVILQYLIHHAINTGINLHVYADNDKKDEDQLRVFQKRHLTEWVDHIYIHRNQCKNEKDYGVTSELIQDGFKKIK